MNDVIDTTDLRCSRCNTVLLHYPGHPDPDTPIPWQTALDIARTAITHGYTCPQTKAPQ